MALDQIDGNVLFYTVVVLVASVALVWWRTSQRLRLKELCIYPVKSCAGMSVQSAEVTEKGFAGDRIFQCTDSNGKYCTPRDKDKAKLFHVTATWERRSTWGKARLTLNAPGQPEYKVDTPDSDAKQVEAEVLCAKEKHILHDCGDKPAAWLKNATGIEGVRLTMMPSSCRRTARVNWKQGDALPKETLMSLADEAPFLLTTVESLADLNKRLAVRGKPAVDMRRFRPNIVISGLRPWEEDTIKKIRIGSMIFHAWQRCGRCVMTTIDRDTLERGSEPLATLATFREREHGERNFGMHLIPGEPVAVSDMSRWIHMDSDVEIVEYDAYRREEWQRLFGGAK